MKTIAKPFVLLSLTLIAGCTTPPAKKAGTASNLDRSKPFCGLMTPARKAQITNQCFEASQENETMRIVEPGAMRRYCGCIVRKSFQIPCDEALRQMKDSKRHFRAAFQNSMDCQGELKIIATR